MRRFNPYFLHCDNVRTPISAHPHIRGVKRATSQCGWGFQHCAAEAHLPHILECDRTLQNPHHWQTVEQAITHCAIVRRLGLHIVTLPIFSRTFTRTLGGVVWA